MSATPTPSRRQGTTLVELLVVLAILAIVTAVVGLAFPRVGAKDATVGDRIVAARRAAIVTGRSVTVVFLVESDSQRVVALPDGSIVGGQFAHIDRLTGSRSDATH